jgi:hypothetical protein
MISFFTKQKRSQEILSRDRFKAVKEKRPRAWRAVVAGFSMKPNDGQAHYGYHQRGWQLRK